jgi:hypothetical protein
MPGPPNAASASAIDRDCRDRLQRCNRRSMTSGVNRRAAIFEHDRFDVAHMRVPDRGSHPAVGDDPPTI